MTIEFKNISACGKSAHRCASKYSRQVELAAKIKLDTINISRCGFYPMRSRIAVSDPDEIVLFALFGVNCPGWPAALKLNSSENKSKISEEVDANSFHLVGRKTVQIERLDRSGNTSTESGKRKVSRLIPRFESQFELMSRAQHLSDLNGQTGVQHEIEVMSRLGSGEFETSIVSCQRKMTQLENVTNDMNQIPKRRNIRLNLNSAKQNQATVLARTKTQPTICESYHRLISEPSSCRRHWRRCCHRSELTKARDKTRHVVDTRRQDRLDSLASQSALPSSSSSSSRYSRRGIKVARSKMLRLVRWPLVHLCLPLCLTTLILLAAITANSVKCCNTLTATSTNTIDHQRETVSVSASNSLVVAAAAARQATSQHKEHPTRTSPHTTNTTGNGGGPLAPASELKPTMLAVPASNGQALGRYDLGQREIKTQDFHRAQEDGTKTTTTSMNRRRRSLPWATTIQQQQRQQHQASSLLMPINELRVSGSKLEPPSRPSQDWSKQRPYFGANLQRNISVELGKTAHLVCKVFELGDKTVSWLRPRENEILTAGKYTYVSDPRISAMNENGSTDWVLEIKDVGLNDSTSYECQVSTDPKLSQIFNLHVQAARARIKSGENNYYPVGANIEFACEILQPPSALHHHNHLHQLGSPSRALNLAAASQADQQIYWYHNGNLLNYAKTLNDFGGSGQQAKQNFTIDWDSTNQLSRLRLANIQLGDSGNYTCKPTSAEPATVRLFVKKHRNGSANRVHYSGGSYHVPNAKEAQRTRQHHDLSADFMEASSASSIICISLSNLVVLFAILLTCLLPNTVMNRIEL